MQPVETGKHSDHVSGSVEQLLRLPWPNDRLDDIVLFHYQPSEN